MKTVKIFRKLNIIANYTDVDKIIAYDDRIYITLKHQIFNKRGCYV